MKFVMSALVLPGLLAACASGEPASYDFDVGEDTGKADLSECADYDGGDLSGDDMLVLINKDEGQLLAKTWAPRDLVGVPSERMIPGRTGVLRLGVVQAYEELADAANEEGGFDLRIRSGYRSFATQCRTFDFWVNSKGLEHAKRFSAEPGRSQHQLGTTIDITSRALNFDVSSDNVDAAEYEWLAENAHRFGFALSYPEGQEDVTGYGFEPWHYRYIGRDAAQEMHDGGFIQETYLQDCLAESPDLRCPQEELPEVQPNEGFIGGDCEADLDCSGAGSDAVCLTEDEGYPGGQCALPCQTSCPDLDGPNALTFCVATEAPSEFVGLCHSQCDRLLFPETGCRGGYQCTEASRPAGSTGNVCLPIDS